MRSLIRAALAVTLLASLGAAPPKKKPESKVRKAATKRAEELTLSLAKQKVSGFVALGRKAFASKEAARASKDPGGGSRAIDTSSLQGWHGGTLWKVVADQGDLVEVRSVRAESEAHCHGASADDPVEIRAFTRKTDLLPLLATEQSEKFRDGSAISFAPGAALGAPIFPKRGGWAVYASGITFELKIPDKAITLSYSAPKTFTFNRKRRDFGRRFDGEWTEPSWQQVDRAAVLYLDGNAVMRGENLPEDLGEVQATEAGSRPDEELLELASTCVRLKVIGKSENGDNRGGVGVGGFGTRDRPTNYRIPKGSALTYPDGSAAGTTLEEMVRVGPKQENGRLCFSFRVEVDVPLCVLAAAVKEEK